MSCSPRNIIRPATGKEVVRYRDGDTRDIITVIMDMDARGDQYVDAEAAQCLRGSDDYATLRNIWKFVKNNVRYQADRPGSEKVKSPGALFKVGSGDCKSFSIAEVALLRTLGFKGIRYRFASYDGLDFTHVYVVCRLHGKDVILDAVHTAFDDEVTYTRKKDIAAARSISGISGIQASKPVSFNGLVALTLLFGGAWLLAKI